MKIGTRITLSFVASGLLVSLLLSLWLIYELLEQSFRILDSSLFEESIKTVRMLKEEQTGALELAEELGGASPFWIEIQDSETKQTLYRSRLARSVDLRSMSTEQGGIIAAVVTSAFRNLLHNPGNRAAFRIRNFSIAEDGDIFRVRAARSMEKLDEEIREVVWVSISGLLLATLVLIAIGRIMAGKILGPVEKIGKLAQSISDRNLSERVPVGGDRDELGDLSETLNKMLDRLQYSFARQREFLFDTSHELKTPLTTMRLAIEELCADGKYGLAEEVEQNLLRLETQVLRMERLVKDLLSLSALEALPQIEAKPVNVTDLLLSLVEEYRPFAEARRIDVVVRARQGISMPGDEEKLRRALSNVLDNAIKYNEDGGSVELDICRPSEKPDSITISVNNTGEGIPEEQTGRVFEQFYRAEKSRSTQRGGAGLGLAIVKKIVELHGGVVVFESNQGGPSRLTMTFPSRNGGQEREER